MKKLVKSCFVAAVAAGATLSTMAESTAVAPQAKQKAVAAEESPDAASAKIVERMKAMRLTKMEFAPPKTIIDAIDFFRDVSKEYDSAEIPEDKRGFNFVLCTDGAEWSAPTIPMIEASNISLYEALRLVCECVDYKFDVLPCQVVRVMSKKNYEEAMEYEKKAEIVRRMEAMRLPEVALEPPKTIADAVAFFYEASKKYDSADIPVEKRGVSMLLQAGGADAPVIPMLRLRDVSLFDALKLVCKCVGYEFEINYEADLAKAIVTIKPCSGSAKCGSSGKSDSIANIENNAGKDPMERSFRIYRFCVDSTKEPTDCMQLSEFVLFDDSGKVIPREKFGLAYNGTGGDDIFGEGEKPECAVDGDIETKWLDFRADHEADEDRRANVWIQFQFAEPTKIAGYRWYTADDCEDRDPRSWRLLGSNDETNWSVIDKVEDFDATSERKALAYTAHL